IVCPCEPIRSIRCGGTRKRRQAPSAARANSSPKRKLSWLISPVVVGWPSASRKTAARTAGGNGSVKKFSSFAAIFGGEPAMRTRATSMPSAEVPDIRPSTRIVRGEAELIGSLRGEGKERRWRKFARISRRSPELSCDLFLQLGEQVKCVERSEVVEVGSAQLVEHLAVNRREHNLLFGRSIRRGRRPRR